MHKQFDSQIDMLEQYTMLQACQQNMDKMNVEELSHYVPQLRNCSTPLPPSAAVKTIETKFDDTLIGKISTCAKAQLMASDLTFANFCK